MNTLCKLSVIGLLFAFGVGAATAQPSVPPFYKALGTMNPSGKLGQVIKQEKIATDVKDAQAWRIAYIHPT